MMLVKNSKNEILFNKTRFILYTLLISLIIGILTGLNDLENDIQLNSKNKYIKNNVMDIKLSSDVGFSKSDYYIVNNIDNTKDVMFINKLNTTINIKNNKINATLISYNDGDHINKHNLKFGRYPYTINEAVIEEGLFNRYKLALGNLITVTDNNKSLKAKKLKIVGVIEKSNYHLLDDETKNNEPFVLVYSNNFSYKYYTNMYITINKENNTDYDKALTDYITILNNKLNPVVNERFKAEKALLETELTMYQEDLNELYNLDLPRESLNSDIKLASNDVQEIKDKLNILNNPNIHILRRSKTIGYKLTKSIIDKYKKIAISLPFLFIAGILIIIIYETVMLIYVDKNEIKALKSLGYNNYQISVKYVFYNLMITLLASLLGSIILNKFIRVVILKKLNILESIFKLTKGFNTKTILELILTITLVCITSTLVYLVSNKKEELD